MPIMIVPPLPMDLLEGRLVPCTRKSYCPTLEISAGERVGGIEYGNASREYFLKTGEYDAVTDKDCAGSGECKIAGRYEW